MEGLGKSIRYYRELHHLTQKELADKLSISPSTIGMYEQDRRVPDISTAAEMAKIFGISLGYLIGTEKSNGNNYSYFQLSDDYLDLKERIRILMKEQNMTDELFMEKTGFDSNTFNSYIYENRIPTLEDLIKIAGVLRVSADYLLDLSQRKRISEEEELLLQSFEKCNDECKKYLLAKAGVLSVEGISAVAAAEFGKYIDSEKKSCPSNGTEGIGA